MTLKLYCLSGQHEMVEDSYILVKTVRKTRPVTHQVCKACRVEQYKNACRGLSKELHEFCRAGLHPMTLENTKFEFTTSVNGDQLIARRCRSCRLALRQKHKYRW